MQNHLVSLMIQVSNYWATLWICWETSNFQKLGSKMRKKQRQNI